LTPTIEHLKAVDEHKDLLSPIKLIKESKNDKVKIIIINPKTIIIITKYLRLNLNK
jgi:hypothetical protein